MKKIVIDTIDHSEYIPIYIELRTLTDSPIIEQINKLIGFDNVNDNYSLKKDTLYLFFLMELMKYLLILKNDLIKRIKSFSDEMVDSKIIITSRPDQSLLELHSFNRFRIKPLNIEQSYNLIRLYDVNSSRIGSSLVLSNKLITEIKIMREKR